MKSSFWVATLCSIFTLIVLSDCGAGAGQAVASTPTRLLPASVLTAQLPDSVGTVEAQVPKPVISVGPPQNSATARVDATAIAQRTATGVARSAELAATITANVKMAPTFTAQAVK